MKILLSCTNNFFLNYFKKFNKYFDIIYYDYLNIGYAF